MLVREHWEKRRRGINERFLIIGYQNGSHHQMTDWGEVYKRKNKKLRDFVCMPLYKVYPSQIYFTMLQHIMVMRRH